LVTDFFSVVIIFTGFFSAMNFPPFCSPFTALGAAIVERVEKKQGKKRKPKETISTRNKASKSTT
jgi:hypothetical protein